MSRATSSAAGAVRNSALWAFSRSAVHSIHRLIPGGSYRSKRWSLRLEAGKAGPEHRPPRWVEKTAQALSRPRPIQTCSRVRSPEMAEKLREYEKKRQRGATPEPFSSKRKGRPKQPIFVVQRHDARRLHYDFRLELEGALASWAVPKGVPLEPGQRALAVHVEDHPLDYATFEGEIPSGNYGAGTVEIWDNGTFELVERKRDGGLTVHLHGKRLEGTWTLIPAHLDGDPKNWLLIKKHDELDREARNDYEPML